MLKRSSKFFLGLLVLLEMVGCNRNLASIQLLEDLTDKNIGVYMGSTYDTIVEEHIEGASILYFNTYSDQIAALKSGKIDGFLTDEPLAKEILKTNDGLKVLDEKLTEDSYAFAINPNRKDLQIAVNTQLQKMKNEGKLQAMEEKWMGSDESKKVLEKYEETSTSKVLKFATVSGSSPFAYMKENEIVGYDIDIIRFICHELGYRLEVIEMSFEGILPALQSGKVDMAGCSIIVTEERKKSVLFSDPNYTGGIVVVVREE